MLHTSGSPTTPTSAASSIFVDAEDHSSLGLLDDDVMAQELKKLDELRRNVKKNLLLRPLSTNNLRAASSSTPQASSASTANGNPSPVTSIEGTIPGSYPFTPATAAYALNPPHSAASTTSEVFYSARPLSTNSITDYYFEDLNSPSPRHDPARSPMSAVFAPPGGFPKTPYTNSEGHMMQQHIVANPPQKLAQPTPKPSPSSLPQIPTDPIKVYHPSELLETLLSFTYPTAPGSSSPRLRPLLIDTRPSGSYLASRMIYSINFSIPSLILKRHRKNLLRGGEGFKDLGSLKGYISTDAGRKNWEEMVCIEDGNSVGLWNGEIIVFDEDMDESDPMAPITSPQPTPSSTGSTASNLSTPSSTTWMLLSLLRPLTKGPLYYLKGGISALRKVERSEEVVVSGEWEIEDEEGSDVEEEGSDAAGSSDAQSLGQSSATMIVTSSSSELNSTPKRTNGSVSEVAMTSSSNPKSLSSTPKSFQLKTIATSSPKPNSASLNPRGLFSIRTDVAAMHRPLPEIEPPTTSPKLVDKMPEEPARLENASLSKPLTMDGGQTLTINTRSKEPVVLKPPPSPRRMLTIATDLSPGSNNRTPQSLNKLAPAPLLHLKGLSQASLEGANPRQEIGHSKSSSVGSVGSDGSTPSSVRTPPSAIDLKTLPPLDGKSLVDGRRPSAFHIPSLGQPSESTSGSPSNTPPQRPRLAKLDMSSAERLKTRSQIQVEGDGKPPKLQLKVGVRANTLATETVEYHDAAAAAGTFKPKLKLDKLNLAPAQQSNVLIVNTPSSPEDSTSCVNANESGWERPPPSPGAGGFNSQFATSTSSSLVAPPSRPRTPKSPLTPLLPPSPMTARPGNGADPTSPVPVFTISTIIPGFLYLGPELVKEEHAKELEDLGVKRILNIAIECDDDYGLKLRERFEKYIRIPMRDTVEEVNVQKVCKEVCEILDDARLHSSPTYVHCKAGKSRSVTAVMAYLIHANHWTLSKAYAFVLDRRKGISPNIGFVSELMNFEEEELGGKSVGVVGSHASGAARRGHHHRRQSKNDGSSTARRRPAHLRESMPPIVQSYSAIATVGEHDSFSGGIGGEYPTDGDTGDSGNGQLMSAGPLGPKGGGLRDAGEEMEVRDSEGRYRHARRAPFNELTLQPVRRVSKAGLETWITE